MRVFHAVLAWLIVFSGQSSLHADWYDALKPGSLSGKVVVQWLEPDLFLFIPDTVAPLKFVRANGNEIRPGTMQTDGGSIPRPMWAFRSYSPWGYAPAFIVHDWLFHMKKCKLDDYQTYTLESAGDVMGEVIKTMMESGKVEKDATTVNLMITAVTSKFARTYWESDVCLPPPSAFGRVPLAEYTIEFK